MPGNRRYLIVGLLLSVSVALSLIVQACPYCPKSDPTFSEKLAESDSACIVQFLESKNGDELSMQTTKFKVLKSLLPKDELKTGSELVVNFGVTANAGDLFLLFGQKVEGEMEWSLPVPMVGSEYDYIRKAPGLNQPEIKRLSYYLKFLDHQNTTISNDAFGEFSRARFEDVEQLAPEISRENLRVWNEQAWQNEPEPQLVVRRAFYGMLLGLCGNQDDAVFLEQKVFAPINPDKNRIGIEGLMGGYLLLKGPAGLRTIVERKMDSLPAVLSADDPRITDLDAIRMTLSFLWDYRRSQFTEESLKTAMRKFLKWPQYADQTVIDLARWKDWQPLDDLIAAYGTEQWSSESAKEKIVAYVLRCRRDVPKHSTAPLPVHAVKAQKFLDGLDPAFVESVRSSSGVGPTSGTPTDITPVSGRGPTDD